MILDAIDMDSEDFSGLLPQLERSFGARFPRDLRHIGTVGDLFGEIEQSRGASTGGERPAVSMAFYALRRAIAPLWNEPDATPATPLRDQGLPPPRRLKARLERETRMELPSVGISMFGWLLALGIGCAALVAFISHEPVLGMAIAILIAVPLKFDGGEYGGEWETLGALASAAVSLNYAGLAEAGARDSEAERWRTLCELLAPIVSVGGRAVEPRQIGPETGLRFR